MKNVLYSLAKNYILPVVMRYNKHYQREMVDPIRLVAILSLFHIVFAYWYWVWTGEVIPEHIYYTFGTIVLFACGYDTAKTFSINNTFMKGSNPDIDNPDL